MCHTWKAAVSYGCYLVLKLTVHIIISNNLQLPADMKAEISSDCACLGFSWVSMTHHGTCRLDYFVTLPHLNKK